MSTGAKVDSIDALRSFRVALIKFIENGNVALTAGESDVERTLAWLEREQGVYWAGQLRKRHDHVQRCEEALREKQIFKSFDGTTPSVVDEQKALAVARRRREEAEQKIVAVKKSIGLLRRESMLYKGRMQKLASALQGDLPRAVHALGRMVSQLDEYVAVQSAGGGLDLGAAIEQFSRAVVAPLQGDTPVRTLAPTADQRRAAVPTTEPPPRPWAASEFPDWQLALLATLPHAAPVPAAEQRVTMVGPLQQSLRWAMLRADPAFEADTGWSFYPVEPTDAPPQTCAVWQLLAAVPTLASLLTLPTGYLVIVDPSGIVTALDADETDQWAAALSGPASGAARASAESLESKE